MNGRLPFGANAVRCEPRRVANAELFVLGVYPSAFHVGWRRPDGRRVSALAVEPEPYPFWRGEDEAERFDALKATWRPEWGTMSRASTVNGSSGKVLHDCVVEPLGLAWDSVWLTDALPFFHVHRGKKSQGAAIENVYDPWVVEQDGLEKHDLPTRPPIKELVARAVAEERDRLRDELAESAAQRVVTLGNEALAVLASIVDDAGDLPAALSPGTGYGDTHVVVLDGRRLIVMPLVHPGQRSIPWRESHAGWIARRRAG